MAKIWPVYDGARPTVGEPWAELPIQEAASLFELRKTDLVSDLTAPPRFGGSHRDLTFAGFKQVVVEVDRNEASEFDWKPGFYRSKVKPREAFAKLIEHIFVSELGAENVDHVTLERAIDSLGAEALRIVVVITPNATKRLKDAAALDALVKLQSRLRDMREPRTPIVEYATEAELAENASS
jgi:hypothetical protein